MFPLSFKCIEVSPPPQPPPIPESPATIEVFPLIMDYMSIGGPPTPPLPGVVD